MNATPVINPIGRDEFLLAVVAIQKASKSCDQFHASVKVHMEKPEMMRRLQALVESGAVASMKDVRLTPKGWQEAGKALDLEVLKTAKASKDARTILTNHIFPSIALGLRPNTVEGRRIVKSSELRAVLLTRIFQLPLDVRKVTLMQAVGALLKRGLAGLGPAPLDPRLAEIAGAAKDFTDADAVRAALFKMALKPQVAGGGQISAGAGEKTAGTAMQPSVEHDAGEIDAFARRVLEVAARVSTAPFVHKAAIAQVYDAYGRQFSDAGTLSTFHARLLRAHMSGLIHLLPLDQPGALAPEAYRRSRVETPDGPAFFIERGNAS